MTIISIRSLISSAAKTLFGLVLTQSRAIRCELRKFRFLTLSAAIRQAGVHLLAVLMFAAASELIAQGAPKRAYSVSVGEVSVTRHVGTDFWSNPDLMVRVRRQDPVVLQQVDRLLKESAKIERKMRTDLRRIKTLREKKTASEIAPEDPLTAAQIERLASLASEMGDTCTKLSAGRCRGCSPYDERAPCPQCAKCTELRYLRKRKQASEVVPGEPLSRDESLELDALQRQEAELKSTIFRIRAERGRLLASITAYTPSMETSLKTVHFGHQELLTVFPDDILQVSVYDKDVTFDDLYGRTEIRLERRTLDAGELKVEMRNVRHVELRFELLSTP